MWYWESAEAPAEKFWITAECGQKDKSLDLERGKNLWGEAAATVSAPRATLYKEVKKLRIQGRVAERITWKETWFGMKEQRNLINFIHQREGYTEINISTEGKKYKYWWEQEIVKESKVGRWGLTYSDQI